MQSGGRTAESSAQQPGNMGMMRSLRCLGFCCLHGNVYSLLTMHVDMKDSFMGNIIFNFLDYLSIVNCGYVDRYSGKIFLSSFDIGVVLSFSFPSINF